MPIIGRGNDTYLLLTGIALTNKVTLGPRVELLPAICATPTDVLATADIVLHLARAFAVD